MNNLGGIVDMDDSHHVFNTSLNSSNAIDILVSMGFVNRKDVVQECTRTVENTISILYDEFLDISEEKEEMWFLDRYVDIQSGYMSDSTDPCDIELLVNEHVSESIPYVKCMTPGQMALLCVWSGKIIQTELVVQLACSKCSNDAKQVLLKQFQSIVLYFYHLQQYILGMLSKSMSSIEFGDLLMVLITNEGVRRPIVSIKYTSALYENIELILAYTYHMYKHCDSTEENKKRVLLQALLYLQSRVTISAVLQTVDGCVITCVCNSAIPWSTLTAPNYEDLTILTMVAEFLESLGGETMTLQRHPSEMQRQVFFLLSDCLSTESLLQDNKPYSQMNVEEYLCSIGEQNGDVLYTSLHKTSSLLFTDAALSSLYNPQKGMHKVCISALACIYSEFVLEHIPIHASLLTSILQSPCTSMVFLAILSSLDTSRYDITTICDAMNVDQLLVILLTTSNVNIIHEICTRQTTQRLKLHSNTIAYIRHIKYNTLQPCVLKVLHFLTEYCHRRLFILTFTQCTPTDTVLLHTCLQLYGISLSFHVRLDVINIMQYSLIFPLLHPTVLAEITTCCIEEEPPKSDFVSFHHISPLSTNAHAKTVLLHYITELSSIISCYPLLLFSISRACDSIEEIHKFFRSQYPSNKTILTMPCGDTVKSMLDSIMYMYSYAVAQVPMARPSQTYTIGVPRSLSMLPLSLVPKENPTTREYQNGQEITPQQTPVVQQQLQEFTYLLKKKEKHMSNVIQLLYHQCRYLTVPVYPTYHLDQFKYMGSQVDLSHVKVNVVHIPLVVSKLSAILLELYDQGVVSIDGHVLLTDIIGDIYDMRCLQKNIVKRHKSSLIAAVQQLLGASPDNIELSTQCMQIGTIREQKSVYSDYNYMQLVSVCHGYIQSVLLPSSDGTIRAASLSISTLHELILELFKHGKYQKDKSDYVYLLLSLFLVTRQCQTGYKNVYVGMSNVHAYQTSCTTSNTVSSRYTVVVQALGGTQRVQDLFVDTQRPDSGIWRNYLVNGASAYFASNTNDSQNAYQLQMYTPQSIQWRNMNDLIGLLQCEEISECLLRHNAVLNGSSQKLLIQVGLGDAFSLFEREALQVCDVGNGVLVETRQPIAILQKYPCEWFLFFAAQCLRYDLTGSVHIEVTKGQFHIFKNMTEKSENMYLLSMCLATMYKLTEESLRTQLGAVGSLETTLHEIDLTRLRHSGCNVTDVNIYQQHRLTVTYIFSLCVLKPTKRQNTKEEYYVNGSKYTHLVPDKTMSSDVYLTSSSMKLTQLQLYCTAEHPYRVQVARTALFDVVDLLQTCVDEKSILHDIYTPIYTHYVLLVLSYSYEALLKLARFETEVRNNEEDNSDTKYESIPVNNDSIHSFLQKDMALPCFQDCVDSNNTFEQLVWPKQEGKITKTVDSTFPVVQDHTTTIFLKLFNQSDVIVSMVQAMYAEYTKESLTQTSSTVYYARFFFLAVVNTLCNTKYTRLEPQLVPNTQEHILSTFTSIPKLAPSKRQCNLLYRLQSMHGILTSLLNLWLPLYIPEKSEISRNAYSIQYQSFYRSHVIPVCACINTTQCTCILEQLIPEQIIICDYIVIFLMTYAKLHTIRISNATLSYIHTRVDKDIINNSLHYESMKPLFTLYNLPLKKSTKRKRNAKVIKHTGQGYLQQWRKEELGNLRGVVYDGYEELEEFIASDSDSD